MVRHGIAVRLRIAAELVFLHRLAPWLQVTICVAVAAVFAAAGAWSLTLQHHFAGEQGAGPVAALLGRGSSAVTAWEGWAAALFFLLAVRRLRGGDPEPPAGRTPLEELSASQLRSGLFREYTAARVALVLLALVSIADMARAARYVVATATGDSLARGVVAATAIEAAGLIAATAVLTAWALAFRAQLDQVGALPGAEIP